MNYFLDLGTHFFNKEEPENIGRGENGLLYNFYENGYFNDGEWTVFTYEPSVSIYNSNLKYIDNISEKFERFEVFNLAVTDYTGFIIFNMHNGNPAGSNCISDNIFMKDYADEKRRDDVDSYKVNCIDILEIINDIVKKDENASIHIKCDIEGSEFTVLPRLLEFENLEKYLKDIYVEWHERFWELLPNYPSILEDKRSIIDGFQKINISIKNHG
jgi:FkbM family methyltransferase